HRQLLVRNTYRSTALAIDDRYGRAPVTLTAYTPVTQAVVDRSFANAERGEIVRQLVEGLLKIKTVEPGHCVARIDHNTVIDKCSLVDITHGIAACRLD